MPSLSTLRTGAFWILLICWSMVAVFSVAVVLAVDGVRQEPNVAGFLLVSAGIGVFGVISTGLWMGSIRISGVFFIVLVGYGLLLAAVGLSLQVAFSDQEFGPGPSAFSLGVTLVGAAITVSYVVLFVVRWQRPGGNTAELGDEQADGDSEGEA